MTKRVVVVPLAPPVWAPPGADLARWRRALADDVVDLLAMLAEVEPALAVVEADRAFAATVGWPGMRVYAQPDLSIAALFGAAAQDGFDQAAIIAGDAPDLPGMQIAKLLRPLTTRPLAAAPIVGEEAGLLGIASRLPAPCWLPDLDLETSTVAAVRAAAPDPTDVIGTPGWHRLRAAGALARLNPDLDGWEQTRALLSGASR